MCLQSQIWPILPPYITQVTTVLTFHIIYSVTCAALPVAIRFSALFFHQMSAVWLLGCTINPALIVIMILSFTIN